MARPLGATNRPQFWTYTTEKERKDYVLWVIKTYKKNPKVAVWYGDQLFGKAAQVLTGVDGGPIQVEISGMVAKKHATHTSPGTNS